MKKTKIISTIVLALVLSAYLSFGFISTVSASVIGTDPGFTTVPQDPNTNTTTAPTGTSNTNTTASPATTGTNGTATPSSTGSTVPATNVTITNPIPSNTIQEFVGLIIKYIIGLIASVAVLMIVIAGFRLVINSGNEKATLEARRMITNAILGLAVSLLAYTIIAIITNALKLQ